MTPLLFTVGPTMAHDYVLAVGAEQLPYFRTEKFAAVNREIATLFKESIDAQPPVEVILLTCSGTGGMEAALINVFTIADRLLIINGGGFGARFVEIAALHSIPYYELKLTPGQSLTQQQLAPFASKKISGVVVNMHETTTGLLYNMQLIGKFCHNQGALLCVDAISAYLADPLSVSTMGIDILITSSQKALALPPGISIVALSSSAQARVAKITAPSLYFNFKEYLSNNQRGQTPFTPAVGLHFQLLARLRKLNELGFVNEIRRVAALAYRFRQGIADLPLTIFPEHSSNALTALTVRPEKSAAVVYKTLIEHYNIFVNPNGGSWGDNLFRVGHLGNITMTDIDRLISVFHELHQENII